MKKVLFIFIIFFLSVGLYAQENGKKKYEAYCEVICYINRFDKKTITIEIDNKKYSVVRDGKEVEVNSETQAMRLLSELGWKYKNAFGSMRELSEKNYYVMSKDIETEEDVFKGLVEKK